MFINLTLVYNLSNDKQKETNMSRASTEMEAMRAKMVEAVEKLSAEDLKAMLLASLSLATTYEMNEMAAATHFKNFENMDFELDLS